jgi:hypothetical protein
MHGDFATFETNFTAYGRLAGRARVDVWGLDRRWTQAGDDLSDFDAMGIDQELDEHRPGPGVRPAPSAGHRRLATIASPLGLLARRLMLAYFYARAKGAQPAGKRHVKGLVPLDRSTLARPRGRGLRQFNWRQRRREYARLAAGEVEEIQRIPDPHRAARHRRSRRAEPVLPAVLRGHLTASGCCRSSAETYFYFGATPLVSPQARRVYDDPLLRRRADHVARGPWSRAGWPGAPPHQSLREEADTDALICGDDPPSTCRSRTSACQVWALLAAGGYGEAALDSTTAPAPPT